MNTKRLYNPFYFIKFKLKPIIKQPTTSDVTLHDELFDDLETIDLEEENEVSSIDSIDDIDNPPSF